MTSEEFTERKDYFRKLSRYYDKVHEENDLRKLREHAKRENRTPKNFVPSDDDEITEVASVAKDTDTEEDSESSSVDSSGKESDNSTVVSKTDQGDAVKDIMPTSEEESEHTVENQTGEVESTNIMPEKENKNTSTLSEELDSSEELDLENMLNETVDYANKQKGTDFEQNKADEENIMTDVQSDDKIIDVQNDALPENEKKEINNEQKENKHAVVLRPCYVSVKKLYIANYKHQTVNEETETEDTVKQLQQKKKKNPAKRKNISDIGKEIQNIMPNADDRYECPKRKCTRHYGTKRALHRHMLNNHSGQKRFHCIEKNDDGTDCIQSYSSQQLLDQHTRGVHGEGFIAYCGETYTWPWQRNAHQKDCTDCNAYV